MSTANAEQAEFWSDLATTWIEIEERIERTAQLPGRLAMDALAPVPGDSVVDLGCGTGITTVELAARVGPGGSVLGIDISEGMLERARTRATPAGAGRVDYRCADVQTHDFGGETFDGAFSRFGVMFYSEPVAAFANVRRSLKPGATLAFACWQEVFANEWMLVPGMAVMSVTGSPPPMPQPGEPGPFSLCDTGRTCELLASSGFGRVEVAAHNDHVALMDEEIPEFAATSLRMGAAREGLKDADDDTRHRALEAVEHALEEKSEDGQVALTRGFLIVSAVAE